MSTRTAHLPARPSRLSEPRGRQQRWVVAAAAAVAAAAHLPVIGSHLAEAPYMGVLFLALTAACTVLAAAICVRDSDALYAAATVTCGLAVLGYAATRLVPFPLLADDVGNWLEPLGILSVASETVVVVAAAWVLLTPGRAALRRGLAS